MSRIEIQNKPVIKLRTLMILVICILGGAAFGQSISGPSTGYVNSSDVFTYDDGSTINGGWTTTIGSIINSYNTGTLQTVVIQWPSGTGTGTVSFHDETYSVIVNMSVTVTNCPAGLLTVGGGGVYCGTPLSVSLNGNQSGVQYQLLLNGTAVGSPVGNPVWNNLTTAGTYTVNATHIASGCSVLMSGNAVITTGTVPTKYLVSGGGAYCSNQPGSTISLSGSQNAVSYSLYHDGVFISSQSGTTAALYWYNNKTVSSNYTIQATHASGCTAAMQGTVSVSQNAAPQSFSVGGAGTYCGSAAITLSGSEAGINYQLSLNGVGNVGSAVAGTGGTLPPWPAVTTSGSYTITPTNPTTGCSTSLNYAIVTINPYPLVPSVSGGGAYCQGASGPAITVTNTQNATVLYALLLNGSTLSTLQGNSGTLKWTNNTAPGTYSVVATYPATGCQKPMNGSITVSQNTLPTKYNVGGGGTYCSPGVTGASITLSGSDSGVNYQLQLTAGNTNVGAPVAGSTGSGLTWPSQTVSGGYQVMAINASTGCTQLMNGTATIGTTQGSVGGSVSPNSGEVYSGSAVSTTLSGYVGAIQKWQSNMGSGWQDIAVTASSPTFSNLTGSIQYRAVVQNGSCPSTTSSIYAITVYPQPVVTGQSLLALGGNTNTLSVQGGYYFYQWYKNGSAITGATTNTLSVATTGSYYVQVKGSSTIALATSNTLQVSSPIDAQTGINFHKVTTLRTAGNTVMPDVYGLAASSFSVDVQYMDGLGRTSQQVGTGQSPLQRDLVQAVVYDNRGRSNTQYLPYAEATLSGAYRTGAVASQTTFYQNLVQDGTAHAASVYDTSPLNRVTEQGAPGADWQPGTGHTLRSAWLVNSQDAGAPAAVQNIRMWTAAGPTGSYYNTGDLSVTKVIDENGHEVYGFDDKLGRTVLKRVQLDGTIESVNVAWLDTYYVYDDFGNLVLQVPPRAVAKLGSVAWDNTFVAQWCYTYLYDGHRRLVEKKAPGVAVTYYAYDPLDRLVLTQDGNLRALNKWAFVKYDRQGRTVMTGLYTNATQNTRPALQQQVVDVLYANAANPWYEDKGATLHGYTNQSFPTANADASALEIMSVSYYDNYDFDANGNDDYGYTSQSIAGEGSQATAFGLPTGTKKVVMGTNTWLYTYQFYDKFGRVIQSRSNNYLSATIDNLTTVIYDFEGKTLQTKTYHNAGGTNQTTVVKKMSYDNAGRLTKIYQNLNGEANDQLVAQYNYNELGQVVEKNLHLLYDAQDGQTGAITADNVVASQYNNENSIIARSSIRLLPGYNKKASTTPYDAKITAVNQAQAEANGRYLQSVDYRYNIRGWLSSINNAQLTADGVMNNDTNDYFGMELLYNVQDAGIANTQNYNGNISATKWKALGAAGAVDGRSYKYTYDKSDKLQAATFQANTGSGWSKESNTLNESMNYDHNGNILALSRNQNQRGLSGVTVTSTPQAIDNLTYTYASGNQLSKVEDGVATTIGTGDFKNGATATTEYTYDGNGNALTDLNKGISGIIYNVLGKAQQITFTDGRQISYVYDAGGTKLSMTTTPSSGSPVTTNYVGGFVYTGSTLNFFSSPEGRVVKNANGFEYQYAMADHQGNTRVVFTSATPTAQTKTATFESSDSPGDFLNYPSGSMINSMSMNNHTAGGTKSLYLNGGYAGMIGVGKSYKVYPGDKVQIGAYGKYNAPTGNSSGLNNFATALLGAFALPTPVAGESGTAASGINAWGTVAAGGFADGSTDNTDTKAFVNIIVFDKNYNRLDVAYAQLVGSPGSYSYMTQNYTIKEAGYVYMYVSNENPTLTDVYFDDVTMTYTPGNVIQYNEYYPFGLQTAESWTRDNVTNNFLYDAGSEVNTTSQLYDLDYRNYDPVLGRMHQVDMMTDIFAGQTPYNYSFNNPVLLSDPSGAIPCLLCQQQGDGTTPERQDGGGDGGGDGSITMNGQPMTMRDPFGNTYWSGGSINYDSYNNALAGYGNPNGISIDGRNLEAYYQNKDGQYGYWEDSPIEGENGVQTRFVSLQTGNDHLDGWNWGAGGRALVRALVPFGNDIYPESEEPGYDPSKRLEIAIMPNLPISPSGGANGIKTSYTVYKAIAKNGKVYWGMTKNFAQRAAQHGKRFVSITEEYVNIGSKGAARGLEQMKFDAAGGIKNLENTINSIGVNNPKLMQYYQEAIQYLNGL